MTYGTKLLAAVIAGTFACAGGQTSDREGADTAVAGGRVASRSGSGVRDACALLTEEELSAMTGEPVATSPGSRGRDHSTCSWYGAQTKTPFLELTVYWRGGKDTWQTQRMGYGMARSIMRSSEGAELDSVVRPGPVAGVGDSAIFADLMPAIVLEDDVLLEMMMFYLPNASRNFRPIAVKILERVKAD